MPLYLGHQRTKTPTTMSTKTDFSKSIFTCWPKAFQMNGEAAIEEQTFGDFLRECVEDPAAAWRIKEVDGTYEVRTNPHHQIYGNKLHGTFETYAEAEQFLLEGLEWDFSNKDYSGPSYDFDRAELVKFLTEEYSEA